MAKISPVSIKYMIHASFRVEGALEKPDIIGALFGQTEGLLGSDLEMRELQKEGKIGRIEVELERRDKSTSGVIKIPTALDQSETTLIAAAVETIEKIGPCDAQVEIEKIEDVRGNKRDYIIERAKKLMLELSGGTDSREISKEINESRRTGAVKEYGDEKLPYGDMSEKELIVVEGRADVLNLLKAGVKNVIAMNGTKLPDSIRKLSEEKDITLFVDGDRGGKLIAQNVVDNAKVKDICVAPSGKEVEELTGKEILQALRKRVSPQEFLAGSSGFSNSSRRDSVRSNDEEPKTEKLSSKMNEDLRKIAGENEGKAVLLDSKLGEIKSVPVRSVVSAIKSAGKVFAIVMDGTATKPMIIAAEDAGVKAIVAKNFSTTDTSIELLSF
ncbi:MAG: DNA primase [Nanoarchaeota archaeon]|nr:DNA primase [Nanoarchaeota archaeon]